MEKKENNIDSLSGWEKILFYKMVEEGQQINQNGSACSYKESISFYNSMKNATKIFNEHNMSLNIKNVLNSLKRYGEEKIENENNISETDIDSLLSMSYNSKENTTESIGDMEIDLKLLETDIDESLRESTAEQEDLLEDFEKFVIANNDVMLFENYTQDTSLLETDINESLRESTAEQEDLLEDFEKFVVANNDVMLFENYTQNILSK